MPTEGVVPTLFLNNQVINTDSDIAAYILKFLFWNPGSTSNQLEEYLVSMRKLAATYAENINTFPAQLERKLNDVLHNYNTQWNSEVTVTDRNDEALTYGLNIRITNGLGELLINTKSLCIKNGLLTIKNEMDEDEEF